MTYTKKSRMRRKRRGLLGFGDAPVTDPHQVDPSLEIEMPDDYVGRDPQFDPNSEETVATVGPIITGAMSGVQKAWDNFVNNWLGPQQTTTSTTVATGPAGSPAATSVSGGGISRNTLLLLAALGIGGYFVFRKKTTRKLSYRQNPGNGARRRRRPSGDVKVTYVRRRRK